MRCLIPFLATFAVLTSSPATAWEADTHYGLTKWLAIQVGFSQVDAEIIAAGAQSADESDALSATEIVPIEVCISGSTEAARHVQHHHYPAPVFLPAPAQKRRVIRAQKSAETAANRWTRQEINAKPGDIPREARLYRFGASLHPLADSWSHEGIPATKWCHIKKEREYLVWAHPLARGGPLSHRPDLTHVDFGRNGSNVKRTIEMAEVVYDHLHDFRGTPTHKRKSFSALFNAVHQFAIGKKAGDKYDWFKKHTNYDNFVTYPCFLKSLHLPGTFWVDCSNGKKTKTVKTTKFEQPQPLNKAITGNLRDFVSAFLFEWIVNKKISFILENAVNVRSVTEKLYRGVPEREKLINSFSWARTVFAIWLNPDHGEVASLGHGLPERTAVFNRLQKILPDKMTLSAKNLKEAIRALGSDDSYNVVPLSTDGNNFGVFFQFRHAVRDTIMLTVNRNGNRWSVVGLSWMIT